jgi:hypothetical protein
VSAFVTYQEELAARTRVEDLLTATRPGYIQQGFVSFGLLTSKFKWVGFGFFENTARTGVFPFGFVRFQVLTAASMMFRIVFWDVLPCKMIILHGSTSQKTILNILLGLFIVFIFLH